MFSTSEILDLAIRIEENGEHYYREAMDRVTDPAFIAVLGSIADEEVAHRDWFIRMKQTGRFQGLDSMQAKIDAFFLRDAVDDHAFSLEEVDFAALTDVESVLRVATGFEEDSIAFYEIISGFIEDQGTLEQLRSIIDEEKRHIALLEDQMDLVSRKNGLVPLGRS